MVGAGLKPLSVVRSPTASFKDRVSPGITMAPSIMSANRWMLVTRGWQQECLVVNSEIFSLIPKARMSSVVTSGGAPSKTVIWAVRSARCAASAAATAADSGSSRVPGSPGFTTTLSSRSVVMEALTGGSSNSPRKVSNGTTNNAGSNPTAIRGAGSRSTRL